MPSVRRPQGVSLSKAALEALAICIAGAALEGLLAGRGAKSRLAQLRQPPYSPPFPVWIGIGFCYYTICFVILSRLIGSTPSPLWRIAFVLLVALLIGNALWNLVFFRLKNLEASAVVLVVYVAMALGFAIILKVVDPVSGWVFLPYVIYLAYATWWFLSLRKLNREVRGQVA